MLRLLILLLLLANGGYLAWSQHWLADLGPWAAPVPQREPGRMQQQIKPEVVALIDTARPPQVNPTAAAQGTTPPPAAPEPAAAMAPTPAAEADTPPTAALPPPASTPATTSAPATPEPAAVAATSPSSKTPLRCFQAGPFDDEQRTTLGTALAKALPKDSWQMDSSVQRGRWIVYSGKLASEDALEARKAELRQLKVAFREVNSKELQPGLVMGTFSAEASAQQGLKDVSRAGVRGAKVLEIRPDTATHHLRLPAINEAQQATVAQAVAQVAGSSSSDLKLQPCR